MTEAQVAGDFARVLRKIGEAEVVVVDRDGHPLATIKSIEEEPYTLSNLIELAEERERERGYAITLDEDYASDLEQIVQERKPWAPLICE
jgi:hypothetical protein